MFRSDRIHGFLRRLLEPNEVLPGRALTAHFLRQFFEAGSATEVETPIVRALAVVSAPMLVAAFWIVTLAHGLQPWAAAGIHYIFVIYAFCAMGCVTTLQWDHLFPNRMDFLILLPLPLQGRTIFRSKLSSIAVLLTLFLLAANIFGTLLIPALAGDQFFLAMASHAAAVVSAGIASALAVLAFESLMIAALPERWFRWVAPLLQTVLITAFLTLFLRAGTVMEALPALLSGGAKGARWFPPLWFLSVYENYVGGSTNTPLVHSLAWRAWLCLPLLLCLVLMVYPMAWAKRHRMALEGSRSARLQDGRFWGVLVHHTVLRRSDSRAIFHFVRQTLTRLSQYHVRLAAYAGAGLGLSLALAVNMEWHNEMPRLMLTPVRTLAVTPLLLFWTVAGMRTAFLLPADLGARWIFRLAGLRTQRVVSTAKLVVFCACCGVIALVMLALARGGWHGSSLGLQAIYGTCCAVLLVDIFFFFEAHIPFTRPSLQGRSSLPMTLAIYIFGVPTLVLLMVTLEHWAGNTIWRTAAACSAAVGLHTFMHWLRGLPSHPVSEDAFLDEASEEVQTLGLST